MRSLAQGIGALVLVLLAVSGDAQSRTDFTGHWREQTSSGRQRQLDIEQKGQSLFVKTTVATSQGTRHIDVKYEIGGQETTYKGLDGDEFRSSVRWEGSALVFDTVEHEDGKDLPEKTVWTLSEDGNSLRVERHSTKSGPINSPVTYVRQP